MRRVGTTLPTTFVRPVILFLLTITIGLVIIFTGGCTPRASDSAQLEMAVVEEALRGGDFQLRTEVPPGATPVTVGVYLVNAYDVNISANTYYLSGYLWMRWQGDIDPMSSMEFANMVEEWSMSRTLIDEEPVLLQDGSKYQIMRFQGRFFQPFDLSDYPLDRQELSIYIENDTSTLDDLVYVADFVDSGYGSRIFIPGWNIRDLQVAELVHDYRTNFGETGNSSIYSTLKFSLELRRLSNLFIWKLLLPLIIVLLTNWLALLLLPTMRDVRTAMPATALLTTVFLHQASMDAIPQVSTLVLMDYIYVFSYFFILLTLAQIIWVNNQVGDGHPSRLQLLRRIDISSAVIQLLVMVLIVTVMIWNKF